MNSPLISSETLHQHLNAPSYVIIDCRFNLTQPDEGQTMYQYAHIPNARYAHLDHDLASPVTEKTGRHPLPTPENFNRALSHWGITPETHVVAYDQANGLFASRLWWLLQSIGHTKVQILNGGLQDYQQHYPLTKDIPVVNPSNYPLKTFTKMPFYTTNEIIELLKKQEITLIDVRTNERFHGQNETIDPIAGHIPGAINIPFDNHLTNDNKFLPANIIASHFESAVDLHKPLIFYCGSGVTSCHSVFALTLAGIPVKTAIYPGSWSEWIRDPSRGVAQ